MRSHVDIAVALIVVVGGVVYILRDQQRRHRNAARWAQREHQADHDFATACGVANDPNARRIALVVRDAIAALATVPSATIHADDGVSQDLGRLPGWDSLDWVEFILDFEDKIVQLDGRHWSGEATRHVDAAIDAAIRGAGGMQGLKVRHLVVAIVAEHHRQPLASSSSP